MVNESSASRPLSSEKRSTPSAQSFASLFFPQTRYPYFAYSDLDELTRADAVYSPAKAWWFAELSLLAYTNETHVREQLARLGLKMHAFYDTNGTQAFLFADRDWAVGVFRGTEVYEHEDLVSDAKAWFSDAATGVGRVHAGFQSALDAVWEHFASDVASVEPTRLWLTGHSLGGALAVLAGARFESASGSPLATPMAVQSYTYGSPRVGDRAFRDASRATHFRVVNRNDLVPLLPTPGLYRHTGRAVYLDGVDQVHFEPTGLIRAKTRALGHARHLRALYKAWRDGRFEAVLSSNLSDHSPLCYAVGLWNALCDDAMPDGGAMSREEL